MRTLKKVGTCDYCQARVVISVTAGSRQALNCTACGAPLTAMDVLAVPPTPAAEPARGEAEQPAYTDRTDKDHANGEKRPRNRDKRRDKRGRNDRDRKRSRDGRDGDDKRSRQRHDRKKRGLRYWFKKIIDEIEDLFD